MNNSPKKRINLSLYISHSALCAIVYCIPLFFIFLNETFQNMWLLFLGNSLFLLCVLLAIIRINSKLYENGSLGTLVFSGLGVTGAAIVIIAILISIIFLSFNASSFGGTQPNTIIQNVPSASASGPTNGFFFMLLVDGVFVNALIGSFASFIAAVTAKRKQKSEKGVKANVTDNVTKNKSVEV